MPTFFKGSLALDVSINLNDSTHSGRGLLAGGGPDKPVTLNATLEFNNWNWTTTVGQSTTLWLLGKEAVSGFQKIIIINQYKDEFIDGGSLAAVDKGDFFFISGNEFVWT